MIKPITPAEAERGTSKPDFVIKAFNDMIAANMRNGQARFTQYEVMDKICANAGFSMSTSDIINSGWLDVEPLFREAGWSVVYDKPGYCESYKAYFIFKRQ